MTGVGDSRRHPAPRQRDCASKARKPFIVPVFIPHAGCPHRCVFCDQRRTTGQPVGLPDIQTINDAITAFLQYRRDAARWSEISFYGGNFLGLAAADQRVLLTLAETFVKQGRIDGIRFSTRPDTIDEERLRTIADFPVTTVEVGVQSLCDRVLTLNQRGHSAAQAEQSLRLLRARTPYRIGVQLMVGLPGDCLDDLLATGRRVAALKPDFTRVYPTLVLRGSRLAHWYAQGRFAPLTLENSLDHTKSLYEIFCRNQIRVIRMGLQPTAELNPDAGVVAGPFHPAYGELVLGALWRDAVLRHLQRNGAGDGTLTIRIHPRSVSRVKGQHHRNIAAWKTQWPIQAVDILCDASLPENLAIVNAAPCPLVEMTPGSN